MKTGKTTLLAAAAALLLAGTASAGARDALGGFTTGLKGLDGRFSQQVFDLNGKPKESSNGTVAFSSSHQFRWEYMKPYPQLIVADGRTVWVYEPDLQQVTRRAQQGAEEQNSPLAALFDPDKLDQRFTVNEMPASAHPDTLQWLQLTPKSDEGDGFRSAQLGFEGNSLSRMTIVDAAGQRTEITFSSWKRNPSFAAGTFKFVPPKGVDVIGDAN